MSSDLVVADSWPRHIRDAMVLALGAAADSSIAPGRNPRVGCVILSPAADVLAVGAHRGPGTPHAEVAALSTLTPDQTSGATAVVTLEPCNHTGHTGPCAEALVAAGVAEVIYAVDDPHAVASGGAAYLRRHGIMVRSGLCRDEATALNRRWFNAIRQNRPHVTWKVASTLDGFSACVDGTSKWITGLSARADVQRLRGEHDAIVVGTGTVFADDPALTLRDVDSVPLPRARQPLRVVMGERPITDQAQIFDDTADTVQLFTRDPRVALQQLWERDVRRVMLEGGPTLAAAFIRAAAVDEIVAYLAPTAFGAGLKALGDIGVDTITHAPQWHLTDVCQIGSDVRISVTTHPLEPEAER